MRLTFVVTAISRIKTAADDFMLKFRFRLDRQLKSFIAASPSRPICSHFDSVYFLELFVVSKSLQSRARLTSFYGSPDH